jgi:putative NADH-flavin reductase
VKMLLLGATGRTGRAVLELALERGHEITAVVRSPEKLDDRHPRLTSIVGDPCDADTLTATLRGHHGVVSTLGPRSLSRAASAIYPASARAILRGTRAAGVRRVLVVSAALLFPNLGPRAAILRFVMRRPLDAAREMETMIVASDLQWTIARPGQLKDDPRTESYRVAAGTLPSPPQPVARADLAHFLVGEFERGEHVREIVGLSGGPAG